MTSGRCLDSRGFLAAALSYFFLWRCLIGGRCIGVGEKTGSGGEAFDTAAAAFAFDAARYLGIDPEARLFGLRRQRFGGLMGKSGLANCLLLACHAGRARLPI